MYKTLVSNLLLFIVTSCTAQTHTAIETDSSITVTNSITWEDLRRPIFYNASSSFGRVLILNPANHFYIYVYSCFSHELTDGGTWKIINDSTVEFKAKDTLFRRFNIIKFFGCNYFIQPAEYNTFVKDVDAVKKEMLNRAQFTNTTISNTSIARRMLRRKYAYSE